MIEEMHVCLCGIYVYIYIYIFIVYRLFAKNNLRVCSSFLKKRSTVGFDRLQVFIIF